MTSKEKGKIMIPKKSMTAEGYPKRRGHGQLCHFSSATPYLWQKKAMPRTSRHVGKGGDKSADANGSRGLETRRPNRVLGEDVGRTGKDEINKNLDCNKQHHLQ